MINVNDVKLAEGLSAVDEALVRLVLHAHNLKRFREDGDVEVVELSEKVVRRYAEIARGLSPDVSGTVEWVLADAGVEL
ncbi:MAG: hypothetical protein L0G69_13305 [Brevibacterium sp.]|nr:hypothetical protein [Brevibacterium sp.]MDN5605487.1 hypothetical protein [Kocuria sp.]